MNIKLFAVLGLILLIPSYIYADTNGVWIDAKDIRGGEFGADETEGESNYIFTSDSNVGIGVDNPTSALEVSGDISGDTIYKGGEEVATQVYVNSRVNSAVEDTKNWADDQFSETQTDTRNWVENQSYQKRVDDACPSGQSIRQINSDGSVVCEYDNYEGINRVSISCNKNSKCIESSRECTNSEREAYNCGKSGCSYRYECTNYRTVCDSRITYVTSCQACVNGNCDRS